MGKGKKKRLEGLTGEQWFRVKYGREPRRELRHCKLAGCTNLTDHNGGYCCPEHCNEHRELRKIGGLP